jgi:small conductance mechanosensitive channel
MGKTGHVVFAAFSPLVVPGITPPDNGTDLDEVLSNDSLTSTDWLHAGGIVVGSIIVAIVLSRVIRRLLGKALGSGFAAIITARLIGYVVFLVGLVYGLNYLGVRVGPLLGALGLGGLVLALALQRVVENFIGGVIIQTRRPFTVGDTVDIDGHVGVVTDVDARTVVLRGLDAAMVRIPNGEVLNGSIVNLTREALRRSELAVGVAYDTNLEHATRVMEEAAERTKRVEAHPTPLVVLREFGDSSINFSVFFWHPSDIPSELVARHDLMLAVHRAFAIEDITIAFPQMVVWPGHDQVDDPYDEHHDHVYTDRPGAAPQPGSQPDAAKWRRRSKS